MTGRPIVKTIRVQPGLNVLIEDSHNVLVEIGASDDSTDTVRSGAVTNIDALIQALRIARTWIAMESSPS